MKPLILFVALLLGGCLAVPYPVSPEVEETEELPFRTDAIVLDLELPEVLEKVAAAMTQAQESIEITDAQALTRTAETDRKLTLDLLLEPEAKRRIEGLGVRYLVIVGPPTTEAYSKGGVIVHIGFYGAASGEETSKLAALVFDLQEERLLKNLRSEAGGSAVALGLFYGLFIFPMDTEGSAAKGVGEAAANIIAEDSGGRPVRVAVMAASSGISFWSSEDLVALRQLRERAANGDSDAMFELAERFGETDPLRKLAEQGDADAQYRLAELLSTEDKWKFLCLAANQNHPEAQDSIGDYYRQGNGPIQQDRLRAYVWYKLAESNGYEGGQSSGLYYKTETGMACCASIYPSERLAEEMTAREEAEAQDMVRDWKPGQCPFES